MHPLRNEIMRGLLLAHQHASSVEVRRDTNNIICSAGFDLLPPAEKRAVMFYLAGLEDATFRLRGWRPEDRQFSSCLED